MIVSNVRTVIGIRLFRIDFESTCNTPTTLHNQRQNSVTFGPSPLLFAVAMLVVEVSLYTAIKTLKVCREEEVHVTST